MFKEKEMTVRERFAYALNNKIYDDLSCNFRKFVMEMYPNIKDDDLVSCKTYYGSKIDIVITVNGETKNISLSRGDIVCIHRERIYSFLLFLKSIEVSNKSLTSLLYYHFGDGTTDGSRPGIKCHGQLLAIEYADEIAYVNEEFENKELLAKVVDHVLINERTGKKVDYFYHGDVRTGIFASAEEVKRNLLEEKNNFQHAFMRIGTMNFMPLHRNHYYSERGEREKNICILKLNLKKYIKKRGK